METDVIIVLPIVIEPDICHSNFTLAGVRLDPNENNLLKIM